MNQEGAILKLANELDILRYNHRVFRRAVMLIFSSMTPVRRQELVDSFERDPGRAILLLKAVEDRIKPDDVLNELRSLLL